MVERPRVLLGQIGRAHGVRGEVRVKSFTADPEAIAGYGPLETEDGTRTLEFASVRPAKTMLIAAIKGVTSREAAEALNGVKLYVPRGRLPEEEDEETFYHSDLLGFEAVDEAGRNYGVIVAIHDFGAGDLLEIAPKGRRSGELLPFTAEFVPEMAMDERRVLIAPPVGFMDEQGDSE